MRRVLVTGSRRWADTTIIRDALAEVWHPDTVLVHDACETGAAALADACWRAWGGTVEPHPSGSVYVPCRDDCRHGPRRVDRRGRDYCPAPPQRRNRHMVELGADLCIAFILARSPGSIGCVLAAKAAGIPIRLHHSGPGADLALARLP